MAKKATVVDETIPQENKPAKGKKEATHYEEWKCEIKVEDGKRVPEKLKKLRPVVKITDEEAETLNNGALNTPRQDHVVMYFKANKQ